jgi:HEAT repeat protein
MNLSKRQSNRGAIRRPKYWTRGVEYSKELGIEGEAELLKLCADVQGDAMARGIACLALGCFEYEPAIPILVGLADHEDLRLVINATRALSMIGSRKAVRPMISLAKDAIRVEVRNRAVDVLGMLRDSRAEETLVRILSDPAEAESTRCSAAAAIGGLSQQSSEALSSLLGALKEPSALMRWTALNTLGLVGDQSIIPLIQVYLVDHEIVPQLPSRITVASAAENALDNIRSCGQFTQTLRK